MQRAFFPPANHDVEQHPRLKPGDKRMWTYMRIFIELRDNATLHIPFREASKVNAFIFCASPILTNENELELAMGWSK